MKKIPIFLAAFSCLVSFTLSEASDIDSQSAELLSMQQKRFEAMVAADLATLKSLIAQDLTYTHTNGETESKRGFLLMLEIETINSTRTSRRAKIGKGLFILMRKRMVFPPIQLLLSSFERQ